MQSSRLKLALRRYWANDRINYSIRVLIALVGIALPCWYLDATTEVTPLVLGIIAAALAETDDNLTGRIKALLMTLACFLIAAFSIEILFDYPLLFAIGLFCSTFGFIMLGAMGARMITTIEYSKSVVDSDADQRLLVSFLPRLPESPGAFSEAQLRWINGHYPEDFALACRRHLPEDGDTRQVR